MRPAKVAFLSLALCDVVLATGNFDPFGSTLVSGSGENEGKEVRDGSRTLEEVAEAFEPARFGAFRMVLVLLLSLDAREV